MTSIPAIVHQMAWSRRLSWEERRLTRRLHRLLPDWDYRLWDNEDQLRLVRDHFPHYAEQHRAIPLGVARADIARYVSLHVFGGFYLDTDYKLLRPLDDAVREAVCIIPLEDADPQNAPKTPDYLGLGNAILGSQPRYRFWSDLIAHIFETKRPEALRRSEDVIETTGPEAMTRFYLAGAARYPEIVLPEKPHFYPAMWRLGTRTSATAETYGVHLHWGSWRNKSFEIAVKTQIRRKINGLFS